MKFHNKKDGFILPMTLILMSVVLIILGSVLSYTSYATHSAAQFKAETQCRLAAQSILEDAKARISTNFTAFYETNKNDLFTDTISRFFANLGYGETRTVGSAPYIVSFSDTTYNGCVVSIVLSAAEQYDVDALKKYVTIRSTATMNGATGRKFSRTIEEVAVYELGQSEVFNYAYFVNNFGWFQGGGGTANGDVRANGDLQLDTQCYINGAMYASKNDENGAYGDIFGGTGRCYSASAYLTTTGDRSRPLDFYANNSSTTSDDVSWTMGYDPDIRSDASQGYGSHENADTLPMPYLGNLDGYKAFASGTIMVGGATVVNDGKYTFDEAGPSGNVSLADKGCLLLVGTQANPIKLTGTVVVDGDVLISGYVTGQGAIYAGRNVHILNNVIYVNPPTWSKSSTMTEAQLQAQAESNATKDLLVLAAKGNVVVGDCTSSSWLSSVKPYITTPFVNSYTCDTSDASIGYPTNFSGNYTNTDSGSKVVTTTKNVITGYDRRGNPIYSSTKVAADSKTRKYYESSVSADVINQYASSSISKIDAVLYNNHAVMGRIGGCQFNGGVICRDEALIYSGSVKFNWDIRLGTRSYDNKALRGKGINVNNIVRLPMTPKPPTLVSWCEYLDK